MKTIIYSGLVMSLVASVNLNALTLNEALDDALTTNPIVLERLKNYDKTIYDLKIAKSEYAPTLDLISKMGYKYNYDRNSFYFRYIQQRGIPYVSKLFSFNSKLI
jgi:outer membrane protein TolC